MPPQIASDVDDINEPFQIFDGPRQETKVRPGRAIAKSPNVTAQSSMTAPSDAGSLRTSVAISPPVPTMPLRMRLVDDEEPCESSIEEASNTPRTSQVIATAHFDVPIPAEVERRLSETLAAGALTGETIEAAYARKEHEVMTLLATLTPLEARALHRRLTMSRGDDALATQFGRLVAARRTRLLAFLTDARRREAVARARR